MGDEGEPLRVLWLIKGLGPGGAEQLLVHHAGALDRSRVTVTAAYLVPWKHHHVATLEGLGVEVQCLHGARDLDPRWVWRLRRLLVHGHFDVVHTHSPLVAAAVRLVARTVRPRPALVYTEHNRWPRHARATRWANRLTFRLDDAQLSVSEDVRAEIPAGLRDRVEPLVHGTDLSGARAATAGRDAARAALGVGPDDVVVGIVANFRKEKAYDVWLRAADLALPRHAALRFVSVGQGPLEAEMRALAASLDLGDRVQLLGYRDDPLAVTAAFDVFTLTSDHEGLPVSLMDAMAMGLPVVATDVGGIPQAVGDSGAAVLVPPRRPDLLADAYVALAGDAALRGEMGAAAKARSAAFDVVAATRRLEAIYEAAAGRRSGGPPSSSA